MKLCFFVATICLVFVFFSCKTDHSPETRQPAPVEFEYYDGYSYKGPIGKPDTTMFYYVNSKAEFDSLFFFIHDHNPSDPIPEDDFAYKKMAAVVKYYDDYFFMKGEAACVLDGVLTLNYSCELAGENLTWTPVIPLIITVDCDFHKIRFIENGVSVKELIL